MALNVSHPVWLESILTVIETGMVASRTDLPSIGFELFPLVLVDVVQIHFVEKTGPDSAEHDDSETIDEGQRMSFPRNGVNGAINRLLFVPG